VKGFSLFIGPKAFPAYSDLVFPILSIGASSSLSEIEDILYSHTTSGVRIEDISSRRTQIQPWLHRILDRVLFPVAMYASQDNIPMPLISRCSYVVKGCDYPHDDQSQPIYLLPLYMSGHKHKRQLISCYHE
jgi:hypothetical protein